MNIKVRALLMTLKMLIIATMIPVVVITVLQFDAEVLLYLALFGFFGFMLWMVYSINLNSLQHEEKIREMQENSKDRISNIVK